METARGQKHPSEAKNGMKESIYGKKWKLLNNLKNPLAGPIRFELQPQIKDTIQQPLFMAQTPEHARST